MFEWLDDFEEFFSCARFVVFAMMSVDGFTKNMVPADKIAFSPVILVQAAFTASSGGFCYSGGILVHRQ